MKTGLHLFLLFLAWDRDDPMFDGKEGDLGSIVQAKLFADARDVVLGRFFADKKLLADLAIVQASGYQG